MLLLSNTRTDHTDHTNTSPLHSARTFSRTQTIFSQITSHHKGYFTMSLCRKSDFGLSPSDPATMSCFNANILKRNPVQSGDDFSPIDENYEERYYLPPVCALERNSVNYATDHYLGGLRAKTSFLLPPGLDCTIENDCVLRWRYVTGNSCVNLGGREFFGIEFNDPRGMDEAWRVFNTEKGLLPDSCPITEGWTVINMSVCGQGGFAEVSNSHILHILCII